MKPSSPLFLGSLTAGHMATLGKFDKVKKNAKGGVLITPEEIQSAFHMLDVDRNGLLTLPTLKKRLGALFPDMTAKEYRFLMNNKKEMTVEDIKVLIL
jgi:Ca2+-binding EF-hand superfamily protein